jgi:hypothetical protein
MNDEFINRLTRHRKVLTYLDLPANKTLWFDKVPKIFTTTVEQFRAGVDSFGAAGAAQSAPVSWEQQNREEMELEDHAFRSPMRFTISMWMISAKRRRRSGR